MRYVLCSGLGGHPEHGDVVYQGDTEIGEVGFFYRASGTHPDDPTVFTSWFVQIVKDYPTNTQVVGADPTEVTLVEVKNDAGQIIGRRLVTTPTVVTAAHLMDAKGPGVRIINNVPDDAHLSGSDKAQRDSSPSEG